MLLNSHSSAYTRCPAEKVCGLVRSTWGTSQGEDKLGARDKILNTKVARRACAGQTFPPYPTLLQMYNVWTTHFLPLLWPCFVGENLQPAFTAVTWFTLLPRPSLKSPPFCQAGSPPQEGEGNDHNGGGGGLHNKSVQYYHSVNQLWRLWRLVIIFFGAFGA